jgi:hypothetical protein
MVGIIVVALCVPNNPLENLAFRAGDLCEDVTASNQYHAWKVGRVFIMGNEKTTDGEVRASVGLCPGDPLRAWRLRLVEHRLNLLGRGPRNLRFTATVTALTSETEFRDVLIQVREE